MELFFATQDRKLRAKSYLSFLHGLSIEDEQATLQEHGELG